MKKLLYIFLITLSVISYSQTAITDSNLSSAVDTCLSTNPVDGLCTNSEYGVMPDWDVSSVTNMNAAFSQQWSNFNADISNWDVSNVTDMYSMFYYNLAFNQDLSSWDVSNVTNMRYMFQDASSFNQDIGSWDVSSVTDMSYMFDSSALSTHNYDRILNNWSGQELQQNVTLSAQGINYCDGASGRQKLIDDFGWTITDGGIDCSTASIEDQTQLDISIYPNPTNNTLFISGNETPIVITIYNVLGKEVLSVKNTNNINVQALPSGVYTIRISDGVGQTNKKFIKN